MLKFQKVVMRCLSLFINLPAPQQSSLTHRLRPVCSPVQFSLVMILIIVMCPFGIPLVHLAYIYGALSTYHVLSTVLFTGEAHGC